MSTAKRRSRRLAAALITGLTVTTAFAAPAGAAQTGTSVSSYTPSSNEWWLSNWDAQKEVWPLTQGSGVTVAVLDTGVQATVSDLNGVVLPGTDTLGYGTNGQKDMASGEDGHGTEVAALIAGQGTGTDGIVGLAPKAKILPIHVQDPSKGTEVALAKGIKYAVDHGSAVINMSVGSPTVSPDLCDLEEQEAVAYALAHNVVVVASSGDTSLHGQIPSQPATCAGVLAVGGVEQDGSLWNGSVQGPNVSAAAPGDHIAVVGRDGRFGNSGQGTSFSAPLVSAAAALVRSKYPSMPWQQVVQRLLYTAIPVGSPIPNDGTGYGIINPAKAVDAAKYPVPASAANPVYARYVAWLQSAAGQSWAKANGVSVPGTGSGGTGATAPSSPSKSGSGALIVILVVVVVIIAAIVLVVVLASRRRSRRGPGAGPGGPGAPGTYPPGGYPAQPPYPQGTYPAPGQYPQGQYPPGGQPAPGQYPPPGQYPQQPPAGQYPPPRQ